MANEQQIIKDLRAQFYDKRANNAPPLGVNLLAISKAQNGGYPKFMYHENHPPVEAENDLMEAAFAARGYVTRYIKHAYPRTLYRRNMEMVKTRIADSKEYEDLPKFPDHVETIVANTLQHENDLKAARVPRGCSEWVCNHSELPETDNGPVEDPQVTIARLRGQLEAAEAVRSGEAAPLPDGALSKDERKAKHK